MVVYPAANDNWSNVANWMSGGNPYGQLPQSGDIVCANGKTVTIDMDLAAYTFDRLTTAATAPAAAGGGFTVGVSCTINANITAGTTRCLTSTGTGTTLVINGNVTGGVGSSNVFGIYCAEACTVAITGNVTGGNSTYNFGISCAAACTVTITGNVTGGSGTQAHGIYCPAACTMTVTGNVTGGSGGGAYGIYCAAACTVTVTGNVTGGSGSGAWGITCVAASTVTITGNVTGGSNGNTAYGIYCKTQTSYVTIRGIITTQTPPIAQSQALNGTIELYFAGIIISKGNMMPFNVQYFILLSSGSTMWTVKTELNTDKSIYTADYAPLGNPAATDTRDGVIFGPVGELTGTLKVPPPAAVLLGVPTDNVVGTLAPASASDVWDHLLTGISVAGSIGKLIKDNLDVPVSSITGTTPAQIWDHLTAAIVTPNSIGELLVDNIDAPISGISSITITDVETALKNYDSARQATVKQDITNSQDIIINEINKVATPVVVPQEKQRPYNWET